MATLPLIPRIIIVVVVSILFSSRSEGQTLKHTYHFKDEHASSLHNNLLANMVLFVVVSLSEFRFCLCP